MADFTNRFSQAVKLRPVLDGARDPQDTKSQAAAPEGCLRGSVGPGSK